LLTFLTIVLIDINKRNFLFIDEPEISMHMKWQQKLLPLIGELAPTTQIIVASHSPSIPNKSTKYLSEIFVSE
jgi:predicted ATPase